jgi:O-antigen/teichoic acid export membrane protein
LTIGPDPTDVLDTPAAGGRVIRGSMLRSVAYLAGLALSLVGAALMIRHLGVEDFGKYVVVTSLIGVVGGISEAGMTNIAVREYSTRVGEDRARLMANLLGLRVAITMAGIAAAAAFALVAGYETAMIVGTLLAGVALLLTMIQQTVSVPLSSSLRFGWVSALEFVRQFVLVVVIVGLVLAGAGLPALLAAPTPVALVVLALSVALVRGVVPLLPAFNRDDWLAILRLAAAYSAATAVGAVYVYAVVIVTSLVASEQESGYFAASFRIFLILISVPSLLITTAFPVLARAARDDRVRLSYALQRLFDIAAIVGCWLALMTVVGAPLAIEVLAGDDFSDSVPVLRIHGIAVAFACVALTFGFVLVSLHDHRVILLAAGAALAMSIGLTLVLVPVLGAEGGAVATVIVEATIAVLYAWRLFVRGDFDLALGGLARVAVAAAAAAALVLVPGLGPALLVILGTAVFFGVLWTLRGIPEEIFEALRPASRRL